MEPRDSQRMNKPEKKIDEKRKNIHKNVWNQNSNNNKIGKREKKIQKQQMIGALCVRAYNL